MGYLETRQRELIQESVERVAMRDRAEREAFVGGGLVSPTFTREEREGLVMAGLMEPMIKSEEVEDEGWRTRVEKFEPEGRR